MCEWVSLPCLESQSGFLFIQSKSARPTRKTEYTLVDPLIRRLSALEVVVVVVVASSPLHLHAPVVPLAI